MSETKHFRISMDSSLPCRLSFKLSLLVFGETLERRCVMNIPCPGDLTQRPTACPLGVLEAVTAGEVSNNETST